jgi:1-acyl-sn-glycerol-3-phosphate acyltransferase
VAIAALATKLCRMPPHDRAPGRLVDPGDLFVRAACGAAALMTKYHRASLDGAHHLPPGPALLVGNHGTFGFETPVFFWLLRCSTGRFPVGLTDRRLFGGVLRPLVQKVGGVPGTAQNAAALLRDGHLVVCYPGGVREVFKRAEDRYRLRWEQTSGFARVAIAARVPVIPFAGLGVDHSFLNFGHLGVATQLLGRYAPPLALGPFPARLRFRLGAPILPPDDPGTAERFKEQVQQAVESLLEAHGAVAQEPAPVVP